MIHIFAQPAAHFALQLGQKHLKEYFGKKIDEQILQRAQAQIETEINTAINSVGKKTKLYFLLTGLNVLVLGAVVTWKNTPITLASLLFSMGLLAFYIKTSIDGFLSAVAYIENFETHIKSYIEDGLKAAKSEGWKNKLALLIDSRDARSYYHLVLEEIIHSTSQWVLSNKKILYFRVGLYAIATACFSISLRELSS